MGTSKPIPLSRSELAFWRQSFLAAELSVLLGDKVQKLNPVGAAHLAAEYANSAVAELRLVKNGGAK